MRYPYFFLTFALSLFCAASATAQTDLVRNGGFEDDATHWSLWPRSGDGQPQVSFDKTQPYRGDAALCFTVPSPSDKPTIYQYVDAQGDNLYRIALAYRYDFSQVTPNATLTIRLHFNKPDGGNGSAGVKTIELPLSETHAGWATYQAYVTTPPQTDRIQMALSSSGVVGHLYLDDITWQDGTHYTIEVAQKPPHIDGKLTDPVWQQATALRGFWQIRQSEPAKTDTQVLITRDQDALYLGFINHEPDISHLKADVIQRDGPVWQDDCNEVFLVNTTNNTLRQYILNARGTQWDGNLYRKAFGDPYQSDASWDGQWVGRTSQTDGQWTSEWRIPFADLGKAPGENSVWQLNLARERKGSDTELSQWNLATGGFHNPEKYATITFREGHVELRRFIEHNQENPLAIARPQSLFQTLIRDEKATPYQACSWEHGFYLSHYPEGVQSQYTPEQWQKKQTEFLEQMSQVGGIGPHLPWIVGQIGWDRIEDYGLQVPFSLYSSAISKQAIANGARFYSTRTKRAEAFDPAMREAALKNLKSYYKRHPQAIRYTWLIDGIDEPTNHLYTSLSKTLRPDADDALSEIDGEIRSSTGFGKYGLYDHFGESIDAADTAKLTRLATLRWWNQQTAETFRQISKLRDQILPDVPYSAFTQNCTADMSFTDVTTLNEDSDWVSADPYPTATLALYGRARALYHTGFTTKVIHDLSGGKTTRIMPQAFIYHGRGPTSANIREWASQALKNGADVLYWYTLGPARQTIPKEHDEMVRVNDVVNHLGPLSLPEETRTAIFFSQASRIANNDRALHSTYSLYSLLGEQLGCWFDFISDTQLTRLPGQLDDYQLIFVPEASYLSRDVIRALADRLEAGATLVVFDPLAFHTADDGEQPAQLRQRILGGELQSQHEHSDITIPPGAFQNDDSLTLALSPRRHHDAQGEVAAYNITAPEDATIVARFLDGQPAGYVRQVGKGRVFYFAVQPFGYSELIVQDTQWSTLLQYWVDQSDEPSNLPIWQFLIPAEDAP